ncbi:hypothetical protein LQZ18_01615 [Lachnospiraceae bacterium ZAX-1]
MIYVSKYPNGQAVDDQLDLATTNQSDITTLFDEKADKSEIPTIPTALNSIIPAYAPGMALAINQAVLYEGTLLLSTEAQTTVGATPDMSKFIDSFLMTYPRYYGDSTGFEEGQAIARQFMGRDNSILIPFNSDDTGASSTWEIDVIDGNPSVTGANGIWSVAGCYFKNGVDNTEGFVLKFGNTLPAEVYVRGRGGLLIEEADVATGESITAKGIAAFIAKDVDGAQTDGNTSGSIDLSKLKNAGMETESTDLADFLIEIWAKLATKADA